MFGILVFLVAQGWLNNVVFCVVQNNCCLFLCDADEYRSTVSQRFCLLQLVNYINLLGSLAFWKHSSLEITLKWPPSGSPLHYGRVSFLAASAYSITIVISFYHAVRCYE